MIPEPIHATYRAYDLSRQMGIAVILAGLLIGAGVVGFFLGQWDAGPYCIDAEEPEGER